MEMPRRVGPLAPVGSGDTEAFGVGFSVLRGVVLPRFPFSHLEAPGADLRVRAPTRGSRDTLRGKSVPQQQRVSEIPITRAAE